MHVIPTSVRATLVSTIALLCGCGQSCSNDKPYVPYKVDPSAPPVAAASELPPPTTSESADPLTNPPSQRFPIVRARKLQAGSTQVTAAGGTYKAPAGSSFELVLEADLDGDGTPDATAWATSNDHATGQLMWFPGGKAQGAPRVLSTLPAAFASSPGCTLEPDLSQIGPHTALMTVHKTCTTDGQPARSTRWWSVAVPSRSPAERLSLTTVDQRSSEHVDLQLDALDRDGDQLDDVLLTVAMTGTEPGFDEDAPPAIAVDLPFFDRPAGLSRDPHEPAASFRSIADKLARQVKSKKARGTVAPIARRVRELFRSICGEWGAVALQVDGAPLQCGAGDAMDRIDRADLEAALQGGDTLRALGLLDRLAQAPGAQRGKAVDELRTMVTRACDAKQVEGYFLPFAPEPAAANGSWGGLAFDSSGALLIRTSASVMRFDAKTRVALPDPPAGPMVPWPLAARSPDGTIQLQSVYDPCDGGPLRIALESAGGLLDEAIPIDPMPGRACVRGAAQTPALWRVGAWTKTGLEIVADDLPVTLSADAKRAKASRMPAQPGNPGGARSADGTTLVMATSEGVAVVPDLAKAQLWSVKGAPDAHLRFHDCAVAPGGAAVACVEGNRTRVLVAGP